MYVCIYTWIDIHIHILCKQKWLYIFVPVYTCTQDASRLDAIHAFFAHTHMYTCIFVSICKCFYLHKVSVRLQYTQSYPALMSCPLVWHISICTVARMDRYVVLLMNIEIQTSVSHADVARAALVNINVYICLHVFIEQNPTPRRGFLFVMFPHQEPEVRGPQEAPATNSSRGVLLLTVTVPNEGT